MAEASNDTGEARQCHCKCHKEGWWVDGAVHAAEIRELEERMRNIVFSHTAVLLMAHEMALELRTRCNEDIHHLQVEVIESKLAALGISHKGMPRKEGSSVPSSIPATGEGKVPTTALDSMEGKARPSTGAGAPTGAPQF